MPPDIAGQVAVVTGAARGIGRAIARQLHHAGARPVVVIDKDKQGLEGSFRQDDGYVLVDHDFSQELSGEEELVDRVVRDAGGLPTLVVNNVGVGGEDSFLDLKDATYDELHRVNFKAPLFFTQQLVKRLPQVDKWRPVAPDDESAQRAAILFISSVHDHVVVHRPAYSTSKAAVAQLTRELAVSLGVYGIRVNAISPGWIRTDPDPHGESQRAKERCLVPGIAAGRPGAPADVANLAVTLLSNCWSGYVTGVNVPVDGGLALNTWMPPAGVSWVEFEPPVPVGQGHTNGKLELQGGVQTVQKLAT